MIVIWNNYTTRSKKIAQAFSDIKVDPSKFLINRLSFRQMVVKGKDSGCSHSRIENYRFFLRIGNIMKRREGHKNRLWLPEKQVNREGNVNAFGLSKNWNSFSEELRNYVVFLSYYKIKDGVRIRLLQDYFMWDNAFSQSTSRWSDRRGLLHRDESYFLASSGLRSRGEKYL